MHFSIAVLYISSLFSTILSTFSDAHLSGSSHDVISGNSHLKFASNLRPPSNERKKIELDKDDEIREMKKEIETLKNLVGKLMDERSRDKCDQNTLEDFDEKLDNFGIEIRNSINEKMEKVNHVLQLNYQNLSGKIQTLQNGFLTNPRQRRTGSNSVTQVAFHVGFSPGTRQISDGNVLRFDTVHFSLGTTFDKASGKFVADIAGVYVFFATIVSGKSSQVRSAIIKNDQTMVNLHSPHIENEFGTGSNLAVVRMQRGDQVWIETVNGNNVDDWSDFGGFLLFPELKWQVVG